MTTPTPTLTVPPLPARWTALHLAAASAWRAARRAWRLAAAERRRALEARRAWAELHRLDDATLADIGLVRADLPWFADREAFSRLAADRHAWNLVFAVRRPTIAVRG